MTQSRGIPDVTAAVAPTASPSGYSDLRQATAIQDPRRQGSRDAQRKAWGNAILPAAQLWGEPQQRLGLAPDELEVFFETQFKALQMVLQTACLNLQAGGRKTKETQGQAAAAAAVAVPKVLFGRAQAVKKVGNKMSKKLREKAVTFSLPPMGLSVSTSVPTV
ncbi:hypothetical protein GQ600_4399 [Phytophthora cactorum]|nr:hypothetical protein GQ600_4399 [Phytophthora cactorum]